MKKLLMLIIPLISLNLSAQTKSNTAPLQEILMTTKNVIEEVNKRTSTNLKMTGDSIIKYQPKDIVFNFETANSKTSNAGIKILIFSIGRKWSKSITNNVAYTYTYPDLVPKDKEKSFTDDFKYELTRTIMDALLEIEKLNIKDKSRLNEFSTKITFSVEEGTDVGGEYSLVPFTINAGRNWNKKATHSVTVTFKQFVSKPLK